MPTKPRKGRKAPPTTDLSRHHVPNRRRALLLMEHLVAGHPLPQQTLVHVAGHDRGPLPTARRDGVKRPQVESSLLVQPAVTRQTVRTQDGKHVPAWHLTSGVSMFSPGAGCPSSSSAGTRSAFMARLRAGTGPKSSSVERPSGNHLGFRKSGFSRRRNFSATCQACPWR